jgi:hypothetical protein
MVHREPCGCIFQNEAVGARAGIMFCDVHRAAVELVTLAGLIVHTDELVSALLSADVADASRRGQVVVGRLLRALEGLPQPDLPPTVPAGER